MDITNSEQPDELSVLQPETKTLEQIPSPNDPPWNSWTALGVFVISLLLILFVPAVFLFPYLISIGKLADGEQLEKFAMSDPTAVLIQLLAIIPAHLLTIGLAWLVVTRANTFPFLKTLGWESGGIRWWHYLVCIIGFFALFAVTVYFYPLQESDLDRLMKTSRYTVLAVAFLATFTAPFTEEVVYRGIMYSAFQRTLGVPLAIAAVTLLFSGIHVYQYRQSPSTIFLIGFLSFLLTLIRAYSNNLWPSVVFHTLINASQSIFPVIEPYIRNVEKPIEQTASILQNLQ